MKDTGHIYTKLVSCWLQKRNMQDNVKMKQRAGQRVSKKTSFNQSNENFVQNIFRQKISLIRKMESFFSSLASALGQNTGTM